MCCTSFSPPSAKFPCSKSHLGLDFFFAGFFEKEKAAQSVTYDALVQLDGTVYDGTVTIDRQGHLAVSLKHAETGREILARFD